MTGPTSEIIDFYASVLRDRSFAAQQLLMKLLRKEIEQSTSKLVAAIEAAAAAEQADD